MRLSFQARVIATAIGSMLLSGALVIGAFGYGHHTMMHRAGDWSVSDEQLELCRANPAEWTRQVADIADVYAYDRDGRPSAPGVRPLTTELVAAVRRDGVGVDVIDGHRMEVKRFSDDGACAWVSLQLRPPPGFVGDLRTGVVAGAAVALLLVLLGAMTFVVWPVLRRVDALRDAAERVGEGGYAPVSDDVGDAISGIGAVLDASHARVTGLEADLRARQGALEQHLAEIAHDLRTPLASMLLALQEASAETGAVTVSRALADAESMSALVDNLHQGSRLRRGSDVADGVTDLREVVSRLGLRFTALARLRDITVEVSVPDEPVLVRGAPTFVERALANLVHNAVAHGEPGGHVAFVLEADTAGFEVVVVDDGPGPQDGAGFDLGSPTFRTDTARMRSNGLGLVITREVVARLGWSLQFEPEEPRGLRVVVRGPR